MTDPPFDIITPVTHDLGDFKVRRTLPAKSRTMVGPFIFVGQFGPAKLPAGHGMDVRPHPHINLSTVTYLFEGAIAHRDSLGTACVIEPGAVNLMTAGRGIVHSERSPTATRPAGPAFYGMQTWLALPDEGGDRPGVRACFGRRPAAGPGRRRQREGTDGDAVGGDRRHRAARRDERAVLVTEGQAELDGWPLEPFTLYVLAPGQPMTLTATTNARALLLGGEAFASRRHVWWNFVSSSRDRIVQAKEDWTARRFPLVPGDEEEFIPIPAVPKTVSYP